MPPTSHSMHGKHAGAICMPWPFYVRAACTASQKIIAPLITSRSPNLLRSSQWSHERRMAFPSTAGAIFIGSNEPPIIMRSDSRGIQSEDRSAQRTVDGLKADQGSACKPPRENGHSPAIATNRRSSGLLPCRNPIECVSSFLSLWWWFR